MPTKEEANKRMMKETYRKREVLKNAPISVEQYQDWKAQGHTDVYIMEQVEMHNAAFNEWKRAAGLIGNKRKEEVKESKLTVSEIMKSEPIQVEEVSTPKEETSEVQQLKYQVKQMEQMKLDHAETLKDYSILQKKHEDVIENKNKLFVLKEEETLMRKELEIRLSAAKQKIERLETETIKAVQETENALNVELQTDVLEHQKRIRILESQNRALNKQVETLEDAEELSVLLAKRFVMASKKD